MKFIRRIIFLTLLCFLSSVLVGQTIKVNEKPLPLDTAVRTGKLPNGFTYFIRHNEEPKNRVIMYLVNKAGSVLEDEDQRGLAHFMEHMSFNGTKHYPHNELVDFLQKSGIRFGADLNAYTSFDETVYELPIPTDKPGLVASGIGIMRDWAQEALLDPVEIDKERGVVLEEKRLGKGAGERMQRIYWPVLLNNSRYAVRLPIGLDTVLDNFKRPEIARFYHDWYRPDLQALIVVGDIDVNQMEKEIKRQFSSLKNPLHERERIKYTIPLNGENHFVVITDKENSSTVAEILIKHRKPPLSTAIDYKKAIVQSLINQMLAGRYGEITRRSDPPYLQGSANISALIGDVDSFDARMTAKPEKLENGFKALWREVVRVKRYGFTQTELERAKASLLNSVSADLQEKNKTNSEEYVNEYKEYFLREIAAPGIDIEYQLTREDLKEINLEDVNNLTDQYITDNNQDIFITGIEKDKNNLPTEEVVNNWIAEVEKEPLKPYIDELGIKPLLAVEPTAGKIVKEEYDKGLNLTTLTLSNGVKVLLKPTTFKNDDIIFNGFSSGGTSLVSDNNYPSASNASAIIPANGVGNYNPNQLAKFLEGKQLNVRPFISERFQGINGSSTTKDMETALQLVYAYFKEPRKDTAIFNGIIEKSKANLINRANNPNTVFNDTVSAVLGSYNIRRTGPNLDKLLSVNLDTAYDIYKQGFADAANFTFTFVGSIDTTTLKLLVEKYLGSLPSTYTNDGAKDLNINIPAGNIAKTVYKGTEPKASVILVYSGKFDYSPSNKVRLDALKEALEIRLLERLREDESGVYSPGVYENTSKLPQARYSFIIQFGCAPQNVEKLIASTLDEIKKLRDVGPLQENVDKWRAEEKSNLETQMQTNGFWLTYLTAQLQNQDDLHQFDSYPAIMSNISVKEVQELAVKYLSGENFIRLVLLPESSAASK